MKKRCHRRAATPRVPMIVVMQNIPDLSITERLSVKAFAGGFANTDHFDNLADCRDIMTLAAAEKDDQQTLTMCELALHALLGIKERYARTQRMGASGEELQALRALVDVSEDFWKRQSGSLFERHYTALKRARQLQKEGGLQA